MRSWRFAGPVARRVRSGWRPGESQTLTVSYDSSELAGAIPVISLSGWNAPVRDIAAPVR